MSIIHYVSSVLLSLNSYTSPVFEQHITTRHNTINTYLTNYIWKAGSLYCTYFLLKKTLSLWYILCVYQPSTGTSTFKGSIYGLCSYILISYPDSASSQCTSKPGFKTVDLWWHVGDYLSGHNVLDLHMTTEAISNDELFPRNCAWWQGVSINAHLYFITET